MLDTVLFGNFLQYLLGITLTLTAIFLILLILVQRGRGGGLAGAFGGMGGQSAFGTKAGDAFTKVTIIASIFWLLLCVASVKFLGSNDGAFGSSAPVPPAGGAAAGGAATDGAATDGAATDGAATDGAATDGAAADGAAADGAAADGAAVGETPAETPSETPAPSDSN